MSIAALVLVPYVTAGIVTVILARKDKLFDSIYSSDYAVIGATVIAALVLWPILAMWAALYLLGKVFQS